MPDILRSLDGVYQFRYAEYWAEGKQACWVMSNPSRGVPRTNPTRRRVRAFTEAWGFGSFVTVNLHPYRADTPQELLDAEYPACNDAFLRLAVSGSDLVIAAWGAHPSAQPERVTGITDDLWCLGATRNGSPLHPLYVPAGSQLVSWPGNNPHPKLFTRM